MFVKQLGGNTKERGAISAAMIENGNLIDLTDREGRTYKLVWVAEISQNPVSFQVLLSMFELHA